MGLLKDITGIKGIDPFDGKNNAASWAVLGAATGGALGGVTALQGLGGGMLAGSLFGGGGQKPSGGKGGGDLAAQAQLGLQSAMVSADAAKYAADKQFQLGQMNIDASLQNSRNSMMGGLVTAAMAANQDTTVRKQLLPHEAGAATIMSWDLAQRWQKTLEMRVAGYTDSAINYELSGRSWQAKFNDSELNALQMRELTKKDVLQNVQLFGIKSDSNPYGIDMPEDEWVAMHKFKKADDILKVNPAEAAQRNAAYAKWKQDMYAQGKGMVVDLYENPQLAGSSILTMKGKDAMIDPRLKDMLKTMGDGGTAHMKTQMEQELQALERGKPQWRNTEGNSAPHLGFYFDAQGNMLKDKMDGGRKISAKDQYNAMMDKYYDERQSIEKRYNTLMSEQTRQKTNWDQAITALTQAEKNPMTDQINELMKSGVIDKYGMVNADALSKHIPQDFLQSPAYSIHNELTPEQEMKLKDDYKKFASMKLDEKLVRTEAMGGGVTRKVLLNPDGTRSASMLEGYMMDAMGNQHFVAMSGERTQDFYDRASMISSYSPLSPGYRAPISQNMMAGGLEKRSTDNYLAKGTASTRATGTQATQPTSVKSPVNAIKPVASPKGIAPLEAGDD